jgi:hypothetical protein
MNEEDSKKSVKLTGTVLDEKGRSVSGAQIYLNEKESRTLFDGSYIFEGLVPGSYDLSFRLDGYKEQKHKVELGQEDVDFKISIEPEIGTGKISGYVISEETELPPSKGGTVLMILPTKNKYVRINPENGYYEFNNLAAGLYTISTSILEYEEEKKEYQLAEGEEKRIDFLIKKEEENEVPWG